MKQMFKRRTELSRSISGSTTSSSSTSSSTASPRNVTVLAVECISAATPSSNGSVLQTGDIVEDIQIGNQIHRSPFKNGMSGVQKLLRRCFKDRQISITVRVRRSGGGGSGQMAELQAFIVESVSGGKTEYVLRGIHDSHYAVRLFDRTEVECYQMQGSRKTRVHHVLHTAKVKDGYVAYPWERKMKGMLKIPNSSTFLSILFLPKSTPSSDPANHDYIDIDDSLARANAWLNASQASGVPIVFNNIQTESFLTKVSGESGSRHANVTSLASLENVANVSLYGFEDYHGIDIGVVRAVRLWYSPVAEEYRVTVHIQEGDSKLGFAISRTEEGFIYVISVIEGDKDGPSSRSGLTDLHKNATESGKLLVISRIDNQRVLPWLVSSSGSIRCFDTVSLSQKLSLHRHAGVPLLIHVFMWDPLANSPPPPPGIHIAAEAPTRYHQHILVDECTDLYYDPILMGGLQEDTNKFAQLQDDHDDAVQLRVLERGAAAREASFRFDHFQFTTI